MDVAPAAATALTEQKFRLRLIQTDKLDDKAKSAIDTLTLALVAGSDHP
jgi:hypothetical protein